ncbi:hypothetical protein [Amycolatopsis sp.]|jgi:cytochrome c biogenesis protein CcdA|uniref:hypothetical protein n=1 Tax=Amycolatopsis sp. TaxID=37632 RepID=UPI002E0AAB92|nr:hypothetical protein [Amycolatopsis sp.]
MWTLVLIGLLGGLITGVSPCILPVLPIVFFAGGSTRAQVEWPRKNRRPYAVIGGLVLSFTVFTLLGSLLIKALHTVTISGTPNLYRLTQTPELEAGDVTLNFTPGLQVYAVTFD